LGRERIAALALVSLTLAAFPLLGLGASAEHAPDASPPEPHRETAHPAYGLPTANDPTCADTPAAWTPPPAVPYPDVVDDIVRTGETDPSFSGSGLATFGGMALVADRSGENRLVDIREPTDPSVFATFGNNDKRDAQLLAFDDCRLYGILVTDFGSDVIEVWNLTDPRSPELVTEIETEDGTHNVALIPGTPILYNAQAGGGGPDGYLTFTDDGPLSDGYEISAFGFEVSSNGTSGSAETEVFDLSDPANPEEVAGFDNGYACHDITFHIDPGADRYRGYCAGIETVQIWDVSQPRAPSVVHTMAYPHAREPVPPTAAAPAAFAHFATIGDDGDTLIVGDETGGGSAPACDASIGTSQGRVTGPAGNLWFYDVSDEQGPQLMGSYSPTNDNVDDAQGGSLPGGALSEATDYEPCTAHFGRVIGQQDRIAVGFYGAGVHLVDFSDPTDPRSLASWDADESIWDVVPYRGHLVTGNQAAGADVLSLVPGAGS
jgi:hypothetical protein